MMILELFIPSLLLLAAAAPPRVEDELARIDAARRAELIALAHRTQEQRLFNDSERLLLEAREAGAAEGEITSLLAELRARRVKVARSPGREEYRVFLESKSYAGARRALARARQALGAKSLARYLQCARSALAQGRAAEAQEALGRAFALDESGALRKRAAADARMAPILARWRAERSLAKLQLGRAILGRDLDLAAMRGKVVLWRSFSL